MVKSVDEKIEFENNFWSDSTTALAWITRSLEYAVYVHNRTKEIRVLTDIEKWRHIPGSKNIADLPSRGCSIDQLIASRWWEGPEWLENSPNRWSKSNIEINENEVKREVKKSAVTLLVKEENTSSLWYTRFLSTFSRIVRVVAWILRFKNNCFSAAEGKRSGELSTEEITKAQVSVLRMMQSEIFKGPRDTFLRRFSRQRGVNKNKN